MAPGWRVAGLFASCVVGCGDDGSPPRGLPSGTTSGADASSSVAAAEASSSTSGAEPDEMPSLDACEAAGVSVCGDGILQAPESCDGTPGCEDCASPPDVRPWGDPVQADTLDVADDGAVAVLRTEDPQTRLYLLAPGGTTEAVVGVDVPLSHLRWVGHDLIVWGGGDVLGFGPSGEERWRMHWPDTAFSTGQASADVIVLGGQWQPVHSPRPAGSSSCSAATVRCGSRRRRGTCARSGRWRGWARTSCSRGPMATTRTVRWSGGSVPTGRPNGRTGACGGRPPPSRSGPRGQQRGRSRRTAPPCCTTPTGCGSRACPVWARWTDTSCRSRSGRSRRWRSACIPSMASGRGGCAPVRPPGQLGWASADSIGAMAWTPRGSLLVALDGEPRLMEVAL